jgi:asparagine synthase (glutamine-hydrolysing)
VVRLSYDRAHSDSFLQRLFALDMQLTLADDDLRKVVTMCEAAGVNVRFPLLDDEVLEFAARVPPEICIKGLKLRHFYKEAFRGVLADQTLTKSKHGFGMPFEPWLAGVPALRDLINESIRRLKRRGLLNGRFLDDVASGSVPEIEAYSHDVHWALMLLELWLERHADQGVLTSRASGLK